MENTRPLRLFHIDDSEDDALVLTRVLRQCPHPVDLKWFPSALEAVDFLEKANEPEFPDLILCDLRMPAMTGHEFIRWLRQSRCKSVTVIVLSSSDLIEDIREAYALGANSFLIKPLASNEILTMVNSVIDYWRKCQQAQQQQAAT
jgi:CheY-like chemotaxis protein